jgi:putative FmdB family regulatory protein
MPIYEYQCSTCGKKFERIQKFSDAPLEVHEECGGHVERLISAPAFHLKGSGWYVTDYAKGGSTKNEAKPDTKAEAKADSNGKGESKSESSASESKSETKTESKPAAPAAKSD